MSPDFEDTQAVNPYVYAGNNPVNNVDPSGEFFFYDDLAFAGAGLIAGVAQQGLSDLFSGHLSSGQQYAAAAFGGAAGGWASLYCGACGGFVGGAAENAFTQSWDILAGRQRGFNWGSLAGDTLWSGALGMVRLPELRVPGVTSGRNSYLGISRQVVTKGFNQTIQRIRPQTGLKIFVGQTVHQLNDSLVWGPSGAGNMWYPTTVR